MASLNTSQHGAYITNSYQKVVRAQLPSGGAASSPTYAQWVLYSVQAPLVSAFQAEGGKESVLKVQTTGEGELVDLIDDFNDGRIQFAFVKVKDPNTTLPKCVLVAWCGEGVPERTKGFFTSHVHAVSQLLHGYHVQVTARSDQDLSPDALIQKVADSSGSKYSGGGAAPPSSSSGPPPPAASKPVLPTKSFGATSGFQPLGSRSRAPAPQGQTDEDGWGEDAPPVTRSQLEKVQSAYQPTKVDMGQLQSQKEPSRYQAPMQSGDNPDVVKGGYQPIGKVDINAIRQQAKDSGNVQDDRPTVVKGAYEPVGKVDIGEIRRKAQGAPSPAPGPAPAPAAPSMSPQPSGGDDDRPKSLADRSAAFQPGSGGSERLTSMPKPAVANRFGSQASNFGGTRAPQPGGFEAKPMAPSAAPVGTASKTFADEGGKTPAQIWAEKKARERGTSGAADTQPPSGFGGAPTSPIQSQQSGGWQSGYGGKKWDVQIPSRTGGSGVSAQRTGDEPPQQEEPEMPTAGGVSAIRDQFKGAAPMGAARGPSDDAPEPPPLDTSSKPNAGARGVPIPGLPQRQESHQDDAPAESHQDMPPPPPRPMPADESDREDDVPQSSGSPVRIAMPVARAPEPEPLSPARDEPPSAVPASSLEKTISQHREPSPEPQAQDDSPARAAGVAAAAATFGAGAATIAQSDAQSGGKEAVAQYDYDKAEDNELALRDGERITNIDMVDEDWWMGQNERGEVGLFPANYVELVEDGGAAGGGPPPAAAPEPEPAPPAPISGGKTATAQYDYEAAEDNEISFPDGAKITDIEFPDDDWWLGEYGGKRGLFPANYVELD